MKTISTPSEFLFTDDLKKLFHRGEIILKKALKKCHTDKRSIKINGVSTMIVKPVTKNARLTLCLLNHPDAIKEFKKFCFEENILLNPKFKREGMLGAADLYQQYAYPYTFFNQILFSCYKEGKSFQANGRETPLVEMCLSGSQQILALNESKQALEIFKSVCAEQNTPLLSIKKQEGMLSATDLSKMYHDPVETFEKLLQKCYDEEIQFTERGETFPLVQRVKSGNIFVLVTNKHPDALAHFIRYAAKNNILLKKAPQTQSNIDEFMKIVREKMNTLKK
ncbi:MAG: hypothetical protein J6V53_01350 [Alphaproteobacteria bacterium]|nr:hypothetical protein [Alphaproteobacteria bacterium]